MSHPLLDVERIERNPKTYLDAVGEVFAIFDDRVQDSGNISYGVRINGDRYFVKTAGHPDDPLPSPGTPKHPDRVSMLQNAVRLRRSCTHAALPELYRVIASPTGPLLVYEWVDGELIRTDSSKRSDPESPFQRFRSLPVPEILCVLDTIYDLHHELVQLGWIAVDFYDGCTIYDFTRRELHIMDLDCYRSGPSQNDRGRMFGSSRFMAPEEFERGAPIDDRTTVFTMGRTAAVFLSDGTLERRPFRGTDAQYAVIRRACHDDRSQRFDTMAAFHAAWQQARQAE